MENILKLCHSVHKTTTAYHPNTNGTVKRFNRSLADMLMYINRDHSNWDTVLPFVTFAYNLAAHDVTGLLSFRLLYDGDPSPFFDAMLPIHQMVDYT